MRVDESRRPTPRPRSEQIDLPAATPRADQSPVPIRDCRFWPIPASLFSRIGLALVTATRHHTTILAPAAAVVPSVAGGPGWDFICAFDTRRSRDAQRRDKAPAQSRRNRHIHARHIG